MLDLGYADPGGGGAKELHWRAFAQIQRVISQGSGDTCFSCCFPACFVLTRKQDAASAAAHRRWLALSARASAALAPLRCW